ncbi:MAG: hypothetical protein CM15mP49_37840 [Actinomycetota bacterium]|nr:MAG: hypothetical protein CM15mP49_37840 [Actinomycetota bacterium]
MTDCPNADGSSERITQFAEQPPMCIDTTKTTQLRWRHQWGHDHPFRCCNAPLTVNNFCLSFSVPLLRWFDLSQNY